MQSSEFSPPLFDYIQFTKNKELQAGQLVGQYTIVQKIDIFGCYQKYRAIESQTNIQVQMKVIDKLAIQKQQGSMRVKQIKKRLVKTESELMRKIKSENVVQLIDVYQSQNIKIIVCQFCKESLFDYIQKKQRVPQKQALYILKHICNGIYDMHKLNIIHRNLKPETIMIKNEVFKVADLSFSRQMPGVIYASVLGTIAIMAPEIMKKQKYGLNADMWSVGVIFYEMLFGKQPYEPKKTTQMLNQIKVKDIYESTSQISQKSLFLLRSLLEVDLNKRMNSQSLKRYLEDQKQMILEKKQDKSQFPQQYQKEQWKKKQQKLKLFLELEIQYYLTKFIFEQIGCVLEELQLQKSRLYIQLLYLLYSRCFFNVSRIECELKDLKVELGIDRKDLDIFVFDVDSLYKEVMGKFNAYSIHLKTQEDKMFSIFYDRYKKITSKEKFDKKDKFFSGIEKIQFEKSDQINFTYQEYILKIIPKVKSKKPRLYKIMNRYIEINNPTLNNFGKKNFDDFVEKTIS